MPIGNEHREQRRQLCQRRHEVCEQIEAIETLGDGGPRLTVVLDDYASTLVRRRLTSERDATAEDVVCAALPFMLGEEDDHYPDEEIAKATARRMSLPPSVQGEPPRLPSAAQEAAGLILEEESAGRLQTICHRYRLRAVDVLRTIMDAALADAVRDRTLMATIVRAARALATDEKEPA